MTPDGPCATQEKPWADNHLLRAITEAQTEFIQGGDLPALMDRLLTVVLELTGSESGVLYEVSRRSDMPSTPRRLTHAPWEQEPPEVRACVEAILATGEPVNRGPGEDGSGPTLLGLPLECRGERMGVVLLANRPGGYDAGITEFLQPFLSACGSLIAGWNQELRRRRAEQELRHTQAQSAERLRLWMDSMQDGVWDMDMTTGQITANRRWLGMLGYEEDELEHTHDTWTRLCHPEDVAQTEHLVTAHMKGLIPLTENEQRLRRKDGGWTWVLTRAKVVERDAQGRPLRMVGTNVDITARKNDENRLRALVRILPDLVFRMSEDGTYLDVQINNGQDLLLDAQRVVGSNLRDMPMPPHLVDQMVLHLGRAIREGTLEVFDYELDMPQGRQYYEARILRSAPGEAVSIIRNITDRKKVEERLLQQEEELRRHRDSLEELVRNRSERLLQATIELEEQQTQLIQAEKMASLGQMAAGVAHEINNPVSYVMSNLGTLDQYVSALTPLLEHQRELMDPASGSGLPEEAFTRLRELWRQADVDYLLEDMPELIEESLAGTRRIKEIAQSLRSFAREDSGEPQLVDVNTELASTLKMVWNELKYKCEVKRDFGPLPAVLCHPTQLAQVFTNLLVNAAQAIETRGEIRIRTRQEGGEVVVEIADTGKGMSPETISKLFTPFFTTKPRGQGTGLGLSVSYGIITRHKGRIEVQSEPGKGSTFIVRLPVAER